MSAHTPGPWHWKAGVNQMVSMNTTVAVVGPKTGDHKVGHYIFSPSDEHGDTLADVNLIAAAPELLDALSRYVRQDELFELTFNNLYETAKKVIAKATGSKA